MDSEQINCAQGVMNILNYESQLLAISILQLCFSTLDGKYWNQGKLYFTMKITLEFGPIFLFLVIICSFIDV